MQPLFAVPPPLNKKPPYYPYNAWSSLPFAIPLLLEPTSIYGLMSGGLAYTSFMWWWSGNEGARTIDVACVGYFLSYPAAMACKSTCLPLAISSASLALGAARYDKSLQLILVVSASGSLSVLAISEEYLILTGTLLSLVSKFAHSFGVYSHGTALFHMISAIVLILIQTRNWEDSVPREACIFELPPP